MLVGSARSLDEDDGVQDDEDVDTDANATTVVDDGSSRVISDRRDKRAWRARGEGAGEYVVALGTMRRSGGRGYVVALGSRHSARLGWGEPERADVTGFSQCRTPSFVPIVVVRLFRSYCPPRVSRPKV